MVIILNSNSTGDVLWRFWTLPPRKGAGTPRRKAKGRHAKTLLRVRCRSVRLLIEGASLLCGLNRLDHQQGVTSGS